ncbi:uncharacterized protein LOC123875050 [Maniola jurtina]|uniref:uncharacterized protein LOC123875050 n=1 Tax=Maniola jurtina TaxID=191418 RepID=UPI001E6862FA|nr:uncharacterized protein LOC123875050 [Maniola jurtina]
MRSVFLISAIVLHISWCYAFPGYGPYQQWIPPFFPDGGIPDFVDRFKEIFPHDVKVTGLSDHESKPGVPGNHGSSYTVTSHFTTIGSDGKLHGEGETIVNNNGKITKYKY